MSIVSVPKAPQIDLSDLDAAIRYAESLGAGMIVYKHPMYLAYKVCHKARTENYDLSWVVHEVRRAVH